MNLNAAKAAELRAKYIENVYGYGLSCEDCEENYLHYVRQDMIAECFPVCENLAAEDCIKDFPCGIQAVPVPPAPCASIDIAPCVSSRLIGINNLEVESYIISEVVTFSGQIFLQLDYFKVNGEIIAQSEPGILVGILLNTGNIEVVNGRVKNIPDYFNSLQNEVVFSLGNEPNKLAVEVPEGATFEIKTAHNTVHSQAHGVIIAQTGLVGVQFTPNGAYEQIPAGVTGSFEPWIRYYEVLDEQRAC